MSGPLDDSAEARAASSRGYRGSAKLVLPTRKWVVFGAWPLALALALRAARAPQASLSMALFLWVVLGIAVPIVLLRIFWSRIGSEEVYGRIEVDAETIRFDGTPIALRDDLASGVILPSARGMPAIVVLNLLGSQAPLRIVPPNEAEAKRLLEALELDTRHRSLELRTLSGVQGLTPFRRVHALFALVGAFLGVWLASLAFGPWVLWGVPAGMLAAVSIAALKVPTRIRIGADGVALEWLIWKRFVRIVDIARASRTVSVQHQSLSLSVAMELVSGETIVMPMGAAENEAQALLVARRIEDAVAAQRMRATSSRATAVLRGGRSPLGWVSHLRTVGTGANADMRNAPVTKEELFDLVENAGESPSARVGAAIALRSLLNPFERKRIRVAGRSSASRDLEVALEAAADAEASEAELARALVRVERRDPH